MDCYPLGELSVHHEVVDVFLGSSQLQFPRDDSHEQRRAASTLQHWINPQSTLFWQRFIHIHTHTHTWWYYDYDYYTRLANQLYTTV